LESSTDSGSTWQEIQVATASPNGTYSYAWTPDAGYYLVRAHYLGTTGPYGESTSTPQVLFVNKANVTLTISASPPSFKMGQNVTVNVGMSPFVQNANVTVSYTFDNKTFIPIKSIVMAKSTMNFTWTVNIPGSFTLVASLPSTSDYNAAIAEVTVNKP
jgi:hypothetical protein